MDRGSMLDAVRADLARTLVALDFDGTLAPVVADPARSRPVPGTVAALQALSAAGAQVAVITGRDARTVLELGGFSAIEGLLVYGLYGVESWHGGDLSTIEEPPALAMLRDRLPAVLAHAGTDDRVWIEDKRLSLVVHARKAADPAAQLALARAPVQRLAGELGLETHDGRDVLEIRIPGYDKGTVLRALVARQDPGVVVFAGDDVGDLPAFELMRELREAGRLAWSIGVISPEATGVGESADLRVDSPSELVQLLSEMVG
ncbi:MAG: trehalose-phosphatase [Actinomycetota bacterium]|nr:trehalose-phosphatase [Actinomycetota bacterium]